MSTLGRELGGKNAWLSALLEAHLKQADRPLPDLKSITADLKRVVKEGIGSLSDDLEVPALSDLVSVQEGVGGSGGLDLAIAVERFLSRAIETFEGTPPHEVLRLLFGMTPTMSGRLAKQRRTAAARKGGYSLATFNRHDEQRLLLLLARRVYVLESEARLTRERLEPSPTANELRAAWLKRFTHYHRVHGVVDQLRLDLIAVLLTFTSIPDERGRDDYLDTTLWRYGHFLLANERFVQELGGVWLMPEPTGDTEAKSAVELIIWHGPYNERGRSWLRTALLQSPGEELHPFAARLHDDPGSTEMLGLWEQWVESCRCDPDVPEPGCRPHQIIDQCERLSILIEEQWNHVRERYRQLPERLVGPAGQGKPRRR